MFTFPPTVIYRHRKENLKKCSLHGLESRSDCLFLTYPRDKIPPLSNYVLLTLGAPPLSIEDKDRGLFLIDGTWRYAALMSRQLPPTFSFVARSLPLGCKTAYPRRQEDCADPDQGLASIEALYIAYSILGRDGTGLLDHYHWRKKFLELNHELLDFFG